ncbi:MAG: secondary thiamine-phosphate synthase enzyme YjbQ [Patescibacteria group bacterium]
MNFTIKTKGHTDIIDITDKVVEIVDQSKIKEGLALIFINGSTAGLTTIEYEPNLVKDLKDFFEKILPENAHYAHNSTWGEANGYAHLRASLLKPDLLVPIESGHLVLGSWQQIVLIDFDNKPRERRIIVKIINQG